MKKIKIVFSILSILYLLSALGSFQHDKLEMGAINLALSLLFYTTKKFI